jgi:hypothetical protein
MVSDHRKDSTPPAIPRVSRSLFAGPVALVSSPTLPLSGSESMTIPNRASAGPVLGSGGMDAGPMPGDCGVDTVPSIEYYVRPKRSRRALATSCYPNGRDFQAAAAPMHRAAYYAYAYLALSAKRAPTLCIFMHQREYWRTVTDFLNSPASEAKAHRDARIVPAALGQARDGARQKRKARPKSAPRCEPGGAGRARGPDPKDRPYDRHRFPEPSPSNRQAPSRNRPALAAPRSPASPPARSSPAPDRPIRPCRH